MTTPSDGSGDSEHDERPWAPPDPQSAAPGDAANSPPAGSDAEPPFDPYRFGAPEHPVPPEYAPPGYRPPPGNEPPQGNDPSSPQSPSAPQWQPGQPPYGSQPPYGAQPPYGSQPPYRYPPHGYPPQDYQPPGYQPHGYGTYGQSPYPPPVGPYGPRRAGNGKAIAALVLGILSIVFFWTTFFDLLLIVPALILGFLALGEARQPGGGGLGMARAGLICTAVGTILAIAFTIFALHRVNHCTDLYGSSGSSYDNCVRHV